DFVGIRIFFVKPPGSGMTAKFYVGLHPLSHFVFLKSQRGRTGFDSPLEAQTACRGWFVGLVKNRTKTINADHEDLALAAEFTATFPKRRLLASETWTAGWRTDGATASVCESISWTLGSQ